jgi:uncharacterized repeat protein (TIGR02543 family)
VAYPAVPTKENHTFANWYADAALTTLWNFPTDTLISDTTLHAKWIARTITTYTVTFDVDGGIGVTHQIVVAGDTVVRPDDPTKTGYTFAGWYADAARTIPWNFPTDTLISDTTLHAKWIALTIPTYRVTFDVAGGSPVDLQTVAVGETVACPADPTKESYTFANWYADAALTTLWNFPTDTLISDTTLHAKWLRDTIPTYRVTFDAAGGTDVTPQVVVAGDTVVRPDDPTKTGYTFAGWYAVTARTIPWNFPTGTLISDTTLHAKWIALTIPTYRVTFDVAGGSPVDLQTVAVGETVACPADPTKESYTFANWYADAALTVLWNFPTDTLISDTTLHAKWLAHTIKTYRVTFDVAGGSGVTPQVVKEGDAVVRPADPTKAGYTFISWYVDDSRTIPWSFSDALTGDTTLYAKWRAILTYTVTFNFNDGTPSLDTAVPFDERVPFITPERPGYLFGGWYTDSANLSQSWSFETSMLQRDTTLYAKWDMITYYVVYHLNGGKNHSGNLDSFTVLSIPTTLYPAAVMGDSVFTGWYNAEVNGSKVDEFDRDSLDNSSLVATITLWARWSSDPVCTNPVIANMNCPDFPYFATPDSVPPYYFAHGGGGDTGYCGNGIPNYNCPSYPGFYQPGGGGDTTYCGKGILNFSCPDYPGYDSVGGGGAMGYCGDTIINLNCPYYPGYDSVGGGGDTGYCGNGIPNYNCPSYPGFYEPGGGGDTSYCGNGIPNFNCSSYPGFYQPGGGGDTTYCGNGILNLHCPDYPGYDSLGGGGSSSGSIQDTTVIITYGGSMSFIDFDNLDLEGVKVLSWMSLDPEVVQLTDRNRGDVSTVGVGEAYVIGFTREPSGFSRVLMSVKVRVTPKPLSISGTWVDTIKVSDGTNYASVTPGVLNGVLEQDAGKLVVNAVATYNNIAAGKNKFITISYTLSGSRAYCYLPPSDSITSGTIASGGSYYNAWGTVMKRDGSESAVVPYPNVNVAYTVNGSKVAKVVRTDAYGRYFIDSLSRNDMLTLKPEKRNTWTLAPESRTVNLQPLPSEEMLGGVVTVEPFIYTSEDTLLLSLALRDENGDMIDIFDREAIKDTIVYPLPCNRSVAHLNITYATAGGTGELAPETGLGEEYTDIVQENDSLISVNVSKPGRKIVTIALPGKRYTVVIDKRYELFDLITEHLGNLRVVINNREHNGGLAFTSCEWWRKKVEEGEDAWKMVEEKKLYYSAGPNAVDVFTPEDAMKIVLHTNDGKTIATCPGTDGKSAADLAGSGNGAAGRLKGKVDDSAYPNPVMAGSKLYLKGAVLFDKEGERYTTFRLYSSQGQLALSGSASAFADGVIMPDTPGTYYLILDGRVGRRAIHIAVVK